jgi:hypothetical protein
LRRRRTNIEPKKDQQFVDLGIKRSFQKGGKMKQLMYGSALVFAVLISLPTTSDAFSRRSHSSDIGPLQATTAPTNGTNGSAQAVPEPPVLWLMSIGFGLFALGYAVRELRKHSKTS